MREMVTRLSYELATKPEMLIEAVRDIGEADQALRVVVDEAVMHRYFCDLNDVKLDDALDRFVRTESSVFTISDDVPYVRGKSVVAEYTSSVDAVLRLARRVLPEKWPHLLSDANSILSERHAWHARRPTAEEFDELAPTLLLLVVEAAEKNGWKTPRRVDEDD